MRNRLLAACLSALVTSALAACSETTFRTDSLSYVRIGDQKIAVSWVELPPDSYDLMVGLVPRPGAMPLDRETAIAAADRVAAGRCLFDRVHAVFPPVEYPVGRFAFRYVCGHGAAPQPPPPGQEED